MQIQLGTMTKLIILLLIASSFLILLVAPVSGFSTTTPACKITSRRTQHTFLHQAASGQSEQSQPPEKDKVKAIILDPFPAAADPNYINVGPVGGSAFLITREGGPTDGELTTDNLYKIVDRTASDLEVNTLVWKCLGYRFMDTKWTTAEVFPKWKDRFPTPPDVIGMQRIFSKDIDGPCLRNNQSLVRSIPVDNKKSYLKEYMKPYGFTGYKIAELTPNLTRRAQCVNWLLFYREELYGYTVEELRERRRLKQLAEEERKAKSGGEEEWKPPVKEVF